MITRYKTYKLTKNIVLHSFDGGSNEAPLSKQLY